MVFFASQRGTDPQSSSFKLYRFCAGSLPGSGTGSPELAPKFVQSTALTDAVREVLPSVTWTTDVRFVADRVRAAVNRATRGSQAGRQTLWIAMSLPEDDVFLRPSPACSSDFGAAPTTSATGRNSTFTSVWSVVRTAWVSGVVRSPQHPQGP
jgi:hypothetical protein